jgi:hypothetical protein
MLVGLAYLQLTSSVRTQLLRKQQYPIFMHQMENFLSKYQVDDHLCRVICWGSSITRQAIENSDIMRKQIAAYGQDIDVQKMYMLGADATTFPYMYEFFETTSRLKPSLICIEDHLFSHTSQNQYNKLVSEFNHLLTAWGAKAPDNRKLNEFGNDNFDKHDNRFETPQQKDTIKVTVLNRKPLTFSDNKRLNEQLQFVLEQKIPVVILNIPHPGKIQKQLITPKEEEAINKQIEAYRKAGFQIEYWTFPYYLPFKYFSDHTHMNKRGRAIYSKWLSQKIADKLAGQCH